MAGLLEGKSRIMDTVLTVDGRRQLANGTLRFSFFSFTDKHTFYEGDLVSGSSDTSLRIFSEAPTLGRDQVTFETDDGGFIIPSSNPAGDLTIVGGRIFSSGTLITGSNVQISAETIFSSSLDNFRNLSIIGSFDPMQEDSGFEVDKTLITFNISDNTPLSVTRNVTEAVIDDAESFFHDRRFSHVKNFRHLPPINKNSLKPLGAFPAHGQRKIQNFEHLTKMLSKKERSTVSFPITSRESNLLTQVFEISRDSVKKLDIIDFGDFNTPQGLRQVYFIGKVFTDSSGNGTFLNIFTVIFE